MGKKWVERSSSLKLNGWPRSVNEFQVQQETPTLENKGGRLESSAVKSSHYSCRRSKFDSQHLCQGAYNHWNL